MNNLKITIYDDNYKENDIVYINEKNEYNVENKENKNKVIKTFTIYEVQFRILSDISNIKELNNITTLYFEDLKDVVSKIKEYKTLWLKDIKKYFKYSNSSYDKELFDYDFNLDRITTKYIKDGFKNNTYFHESKYNYHIYCNHLITIYKIEVIEKQKSYKFFTED